MAKYKLCGAKTRRGTKCKRKPTINDKGEIANGRCKFHGGMSTGAPKGNQNGRKHGIYCRTYSEEEKKLMQDVDIAGVDHELMELKIWYHRVLQAELNVLADPNNLGNGFDITEVKESAMPQDSFEGEIAATTGPTILEIKRKRPDFVAIKALILGRINSFHKTKAIINGNTGDDKPKDFADTLRDHMRDMAYLTNGPE